MIRDYQAQIAAAAEDAKATLLELVIDQCRKRKALYAAMTPLPGDSPEEAKDKAEQLARLAGVKLGPPTYITESSYATPIIYRDYAGVTPAPGMAEGKTSIVPGELTVNIAVQVTYAIQ